MNSLFICNWRNSIVQRTVNNYRRTRTATDMDSFFARNKGDTSAQKTLYSEHHPAGWEES